ncbi:DUF1491 family protein [Methylovirgula sp. 4M-Z18]|uniref:DUF1491 family protein n=1 Tax=Methylovirgula sp. 4M-Z18 TaxID=2293567 RepID=UPI000E2F9622|nr:DUF1491 family protein [Methylovirgula sp. 4M-Z18]RFB79572.1 DUF1491 family protein [Methylovirgula sp. 4M-Z18]
MRLRSDFWVSAYIRRCETAGASAYLRRRGAAEAGAIFIRVDRLDGTSCLFGPAPQTEFAEESVERRWVRMHDAPWLDNPEIEQRLQREVRFDTDLWIVDVEDREGRSFLD